MKYKRYLQRKKKIEKDYETNSLYEVCSCCLPYAMDNHGKHFFDSPFPILEYWINSLKTFLFLVIQNDDLQIERLLKAIFKITSQKFKLLYKLCSNHHF